MFYKCSALSQDSQIPGDAVLQLSTLSRLIHTSSLSAGVSVLPKGTLAYRLELPRIEPPTFQCPALPPQPPLKETFHPTLPRADMSPKVYPECTWFPPAEDQTRLRHQRWLCSCLGPLSSSTNPTALSDSRPSLTLLPD